MLLITSPVLALRFNEAPAFLPGKTSFGFRTTIRSALLQ